MGTRSRPNIEVAGGCLYSVQQYVVQRRFQAKRNITDLGQQRGLSREKVYLEISMAEAVGVAVPNRQEHLLNQLAAPLLRVVALNNDATKRSGDISVVSATSKAFFST